MTATLNGRTCVEVRATLPRHGNWLAWATLADEPEVSTAPGAVAIDVAGLALRGTALRQSEHNGQRVVEVIGGLGGWRQPVRPQGFRLDRLVPRAQYIERLAADVGEVVLLDELAAIDRPLGAVVARLGDVTAGALLSQVCAAQGGDPVPWWVAPNGVTRFGTRTGSDASALNATESDEYARAKGYAEEDASPLLPGGTVNGEVIEELRLEATPTSQRQWITLAAPAEEPLTLARLFRRGVLAIVGPLVSASRIYRYIVREVYPDGRIRAVPQRGLLAPDLDGLRLAPGLAGGRARPRVGSRIFVQFADGDPVAGAAVVTNFETATGPGIPLETELDGDLVRLAKGMSPVARVGDVVSLPLGIGVAGNVLTLTYVDAAGTPFVFSVTGTVAVGPPLPLTEVHGTVQTGRPEVLA